MKNLWDTLVISFLVFVLGILLGLGLGQLALKEYKKEAFETGHMEKLIDHQNDKVIYRWKELSETSNPEPSEIKD